MKLRLTLIVIIGSVFTIAQAQGVAINETGALPDSAAMLDVSSSRKGLLPPRLTVMQRNSIMNPPPGLMIYNIDANCMEWWNGSGWYNACSGNTSTPGFPPGTVFCVSGPTAIVPVVNPITGRTWMDRNLGASQQAQHITDQNSYGDLYQWGRPADGHQCRNSTMVASLSSVDQPGHPSFIIGFLDWRNPLNFSLWQGVNGTNNPCPIGYRIPTEAELNSERLSWSVNNANGAYASPLRWPMAGARGYSNGALSYVNTEGTIWTTTFIGSQIRRIRFNQTQAFFASDGTASGISVRCTMN